MNYIPGHGGQLVRSAGTFSKVIAKDGIFVTLSLPSGEMRLVEKFCWATIGQVDNIDFFNINFGKAGRKRWFGVRPRVRGVAKNPCDHPHGGGEGRSPIGRAKPVTPWGKATLGKKTRSPKLQSNIYIVRSRKTS